MRSLFLLIMSLLLLISACEPTLPQDELLPCTTDVKECPDGSYVSRVPPDCRFQACPFVNPDAQSCPNDYLECADGTFVQRSGPDCDFAQCPIDDNPPEVCDYNDPSRRFILEDADACSRARFACEIGEEAFINDCGCGCIYERPGPGASDEILCRDENRFGQVCTNDFVQVCGLRLDGSLKDYQNSCLACEDPAVYGYLEGLCLPRPRTNMDGFFTSNPN